MMVTLSVIEFQLGTHTTTVVVQYAGSSPIQGTLERRHTRMPPSKEQMRVHRKHGDDDGDDYAEMDELRRCGNQRLGDDLETGLE